MDNGQVAVVKYIDSVQLPCFSPVELCSAGRTLRLTTPRKHHMLFYRPWFQDLRQAARMIILCPIFSGLSISKRG